MSQLLTTLLDLIFPPTAAERSVRAITPESMHDYYRPRQQTGVTALARYHDPALTLLIKQNKYHNDRIAAAKLAFLVDHWLDDTGPAVFLPIPLSRTRERERGYNQTERILRSLPNCTIDTTILRRSRDTLPQSDLDRTRRFANVQSAFTANLNRLRHHSGQRLVLFDDVVTTGATLQAARATLEPHLPPGTTLVCLAATYS